MRMLWEDRANEHLARAGYENRIDARSYAEQGVALEAARTVHVGQVYAEERDAVRGTERILPVERLDREQSARNAAAIEADPSLLLDRITRSEAVFTRHDVARSLHRFVNEDMGRFEHTLNQVMHSEELVCLVEGGRTADTGREVEPVWTTREVAEREAAMLDRADRLASSGQGGFSERSISQGIAAVENGVAIENARAAESGAAVRDGEGRDGGPSRSSSPSDGERFALSEEQREAVRTLGNDGQLAVLRGVAGTGKTTALSAFREAAEIEGTRIVGGALAGKAARELEEGSGIESRTLASWERGWDGGFDRLGRGDVFVMDEAGMVGSAQMARVMARVEEAGAKLVLVGDERQLQPIEAGAAFRNVKERVAGEDGAAQEKGDASERLMSERAPVAELTGVRRQAEGWQREASAAFGQGEAGAALDAYRERGEVRLHDSTEQTHAAIVAGYFAERDRALGIEGQEGGANATAEGSERDRQGRADVQDAAQEANERRGWFGSIRAAMGLERDRGPEEGRSDGRGAEAAADRVPGREPDHIVTAYRNVDVDALNGAIRAERVRRGELGEGASYRTDRGRVELARGDHVLLTANDRQLGVANGDRGIVTAASEDRLRLRTRDGRDVEIDAGRYGGVRHGYAVTTHRAQGMTVDRVHVMAGRGMDAPLTYVAMTRQREGATLHASRDHFRDYATLRDAIGRDRRAQGIGDYLPRNGNALRAVAERVHETKRMRAAERAAGQGAERSVGRSTQRSSERGGENVQDRGARLRAMLVAQRSGPSEADEARRERIREALAQQGQEQDRGRERGSDRSATGAGRDAADHTRDTNREQSPIARGSGAERTARSEGAIRTGQDETDRREALRQRLWDHAASRDGTADEVRHERLREALRERGAGRQDGADRGADRSAGRDRDRGKGQNADRGADRGSDRTLGNGPGRGGGGQGNDGGAGL